MTLQKKEAVWSAVKRLIPVPGLSSKNLNTNGKSVDQRITLMSYHKTSGCVHGENVWHSMNRHFTKWAFHVMEKDGSNRNKMLHFFQQIKVLKKHYFEEIEQRYRGDGKWNRDTQLLLQFLSTQSISQLVKYATLPSISFVFFFQMTEKIFKCFVDHASYKALHFWIKTWINIYDVEVCSTANLRLSGCLEPEFDHQNFGGFSLGFYFPNYQFFVHPWT